MSKLHFSAIDSPPRELLLLDPAAPTAQLAEALVAHWQEVRRQEPPLLALIPERQHAALLESLRRRFLALPAEPLTASEERELRTAIRILCDGGACLVYGGQAGRPALLTNLLLNDAWRLASTSPLPLLALGTMEANPGLGEHAESTFLGRPFGGPGQAART